MAADASWRPLNHRDPQARRDAGPAPKARRFACFGQDSGFAAKTTASSVSPCLRGSESHLRHPEHLLDLWKTPSTAQIPFVAAIQMILPSAPNSRTAVASAWMPKPVVRAPAAFE